MIEMDDNIFRKSVAEFSVLMCVYQNDNSIHFEEAIISVVNQSVYPNEIIILVDGPIPNSISNIIEKYKLYKNFKIIKLFDNVGHGEARRIALDKCSYNYVALMDADDICVEDRFEKQINHMIRNPNISVLGGIISEFTESVENTTGIRDVPRHDKQIKKYMKSRCPFNQVTVMFKKADVIKAGGYINWYNEEDYYLWIRMSQTGVLFENLSEILVNVRVGKEMYQRRGGIRYFLSETRIQKYMYQNKIIGIVRLSYNICIRFFLQVAMPNKVRGFLFRKLARKSLNSIKE